MTAKSDKIKANIAASKAKGAATKAAKEAAANKQQSTAEKSGGRFVDPKTGDLVTVGLSPSGGRNISLTLGETLGLSDSVSATRVTRSGGASSQSSAQVFSSLIKKKETKTLTKEEKTNKKGGRDLSVTLEEDLRVGETKGGGAVAPFGGAFVAGAVALFGGSPDKGFRAEVKSNEPHLVKEERNVLDDLREGAIGFGEVIKNFAAEGLEAELSRGSGTVASSGGQVAIIDPFTKELVKETKKQITPNTLPQKLFEGRFDEINLEDPKTIGQGVGFGALLAAPPAGAKSVVKIVENIAVKGSKGAAKSFDDFLKGIGETTGLQRIFTPIEKTIVGPLLPKNPKVINPATGKSYKFSKTIETEPPLTGKDVFISTGGTESAPSSIKLLKTGKPDTVFGPKLKNPVDEFKNVGDKPVFSPKSVDIKGSLGAKQIKDLGVKPDIGSDFRFSSNLKTAKQKSTFNEMVLQGGIKETAKGQTTELSNILKGSGKILEDIKKPPSVFAQTKAEKIPDLIGKRNTGTPQTPFKFGPEPPTKGGAGGAGKGAAILKDVRETVITKEVNKLLQKEMDILFKGPRFTGGVSGVAPQVLTTKNEFSGPKSKGKLTFQDEIQTTLNPKKDKVISASMVGIAFADTVSFKQGKKQQGGLVSGIKFKDEFNTVKITKQKGGIDETFRFKERFSFKLDTPTPLIPDTELPPPPPFTPPPPARPPVLVGPFPRGISLASFAGGRSKSSRKSFLGFGISKNINVGDLPTFSRVGRSKKVFGAVSKEDKRVQDMLFGKPKRKSKKSKKKGRGKKK